MARTLAAVAASSVATGVLNVFWMWLVVGGGRARDTGFSILLAPLLDFGLNPAKLLPDSFSEYRALDSMADLVAFLPWTLLWCLGLHLTLAVAVMPLVQWRLRKVKSSDVAAALPAAAMFFTFLPAILIPADSLAARAMGMLLRDDVDLALRLARMTAVFSALMIVGGPALKCFQSARVRETSDRLLAGLRTAGLAACAVGALGFALPSGPTGSALGAAPGSPNVLLVSIDSLRADHLSCYGYNRSTSPAIDGLAAEGARFETVVTPSSWTLPSHVSLLTALDPLAHGVTSDSTRLAGGFKTLAEQFLEGGYTTAGIVSAPYLDAKFGFSQGFQHYDDFSIGSGLFGANEVEVTSPDAVRLTTRWLSQWKTSDDRRPFFLFLHLWDVHYDFNPPEPYDSMFDPDYRGDITGRDFAANPRIRPDMPQADLERLIALYDGEIRYADEHLSRILDHLRDLGELDQTVIAVTSDHGDEFLEHGFHGHRQTLYDEVLLAPLVVRYPAEIEAGVVVSEPIRLIDVGLTLLELAGVDSFRFGPESDNLYSARSAASLLQAGAPRDEAPRLAFLDLEGGLLRAVRTPDKKYITMNGGEETWVFDLSADPDETKNLALEDPQRTAALGALVSEWSGQADPEAGVERVQMAPEQVKVLRSLGYIQ